MNGALVRGERRLDLGLGFEDVDVPTQPKHGARDDEGHPEEPERHTNHKGRRAIEGGLTGT